MISSAYPHERAMRTLKLNETAFIFPLFSASFPCHYSSSLTSLCSLSTSLALLNFSFIALSIFLSLNLLHLHTCTLYFTNDEAHHWCPPEPGSYQGPEPCWPASPHNCETSLSWPDCSSHCVWILRNQHMQNTWQQTHKKFIHIPNENWRYFKWNCRDFCPSPGNRFWWPPNFSFSSTHNWKCDMN